MFTKSSVAFQLTAEGLFQPGFRVYFWTFTFSELRADYVCLKLWSEFLGHLKKRFTDCAWGGVRVAELHRTHGVHFHALFNRRLPVDLVRQVAKQYGFGRIHVKVADKGAGPYLAKYLRKQKEAPVSESGGRSRRWAAFGAVARVLVKNIENCSPQWLYRREHGLGFTTYQWEWVLNRVWDFGEDAFKACWWAIRSERYGDAIDWARGRLRVDRLGVASFRMPDVIGNPF